jgi:hypothetical protein
MSEILVKQVKKRFDFSDTPRFEGFYYIKRTTRDTYGSENHEYLWPDGTWFTSAWSTDSLHSYYRTKEEIKSAVHNLLRRERENAANR